MGETLSFHAWKKELCWLSKDRKKNANLFSSKTN